jgi:hypothetical protein
MESVECLVARALALAGREVIVVERETGLERPVLASNRSGIPGEIFNLVGWAEASRNAEPVFARLARPRD